MRKHYEYAIAVVYDNAAIVAGASLFWFSFIALSWAFRG
jgi:hypothetical protein